MSEQISLQADVPTELGGKRLDQVLAQLFPDYSRSRIKTWILDDKITVDGEIFNTPREKLLGGEVVSVETTIEAPREYEAQDIKLNIVYEDDDILVINKPMGLVVHPGAGNPNGTVLNALLHYYPEIINVPRAGIVHRLDKDTTGLMVVAKTIQAQTHLVKALQKRENFTREYEALCNGTMTAGGMVEKAIGRHPTQRTHMAVHEMGKPAITHYRVAEKFRAHTRLRLRLETGRTHQIRVHMAHLNHPLIGDQSYGGRPRPPKGATPELFELLRSFRRQALHAVKLSIAHPITGEMMTWQAPIPDDMVAMTHALREDTKANPDIDR
ncbi:23S rRNA pseudouridine(1911/1915/1917) synthase RluD [Pseudoalteromonas sp. SR43-6]|jgi:23S rRNA pseudouridine1911/1915/1917 synthase|uniref:Pseudouridine synthase n=1 Tax=Pseudoalteromonas issachenkonii TaxID=152297 RepID=A0ABU9GX08_9GAMM|nr:MULTISPECIES: 23S rRNA pseudouridine(1911/1915/1917) synthase RluD [Pseudoalteromonas]KAA1151308.1 23S rRNA pseudouridine(1911/1915/1917) synthase RluD [Pseudoalteromonas sp. FUC4]MBB1278799.1 23S rRNA pseudouridine(1911/1915/1917) synthase RluD [Pseudoalteromonas sp. SR43-3]MBB1289608.1 23S rRNA pseudouridine(1911/1915/1917) synthase RluD [Pseudoalteromonas sp. SR41-5]MBB1297839.1 23S rRNA pseudouridine(1911/1915/1917) synthase RluD [Pseudoalteromonas sp. SR41-7]MBB1326891.1 23S rRNA pseud